MAKRTIRNATPEEITAQREGYARGYKPGPRQARAIKPPAPAPIAQTKDERSLLLFLETCAVDDYGWVRGAHMNAEEFAKAKEWNASGFVKFGRIFMRGDALGRVNRNNGGMRAPRTNWCELSDQAWDEAAAERRARAARLAEQRDAKYPRAEFLNGYEKENP